MNSGKQSFPLWPTVSKSEGLLPKPVSQVDPSPRVPPLSISWGATTGSSGLTEAAIVMNTIAAMEPRASVTHFPVPSFITLPTQDPSTSRDSALSIAMTQFVTTEIKARKSNKEKLKAVLAVMNSMEENELEKVGSIPRSMHVPSPQTLGTYLGLL